MKSNSSKRGTISSFFLSVAEKKRKTDNQTSDTASTSAEKEVTPSGTSNLLIIDSGGIGHVPEPVASPTTSCSIVSNTRCSSTDSPSEPVSSPTTSSSILSISPSISSTDGCPSSIELSSQPVSPSLSTLPIDISRSVADQPARPILSSYKPNQENRTFQKNWFINRPWLEYSIENDRVYCFYCRHFCSTNSSINRNQSDSFLTGYNNWKNALDKRNGFTQHETSVAHITAAANYEEYLAREKSKSTVMNIIDKGRLEQIRKNRERLIKIASTIFLCGRQLISLRGHEEHSQSVKNILHFVAMYFFPFCLGQITEETFWKSSNGLVKLIQLFNQYSMIQRTMQRIYHHLFKMNFCI